jgi:hypothetical protein
LFGESVWQHGRAPNIPHPYQNIPLDCTSLLLLQFAKEKPLWKQFDRRSLLHCKSDSGKSSSSFYASPPIPLPTLILAIQQVIHCSSSAQLTILLANKRISKRMEQTSKSFQRNFLKNFSFQIFSEKMKKSYNLVLHTIPLTKMLWFPLFLKIENFHNSRLDDAWRNSHQHM